MIRKGSIEEALEVASVIPEFSDLYSRDEFERRLGAGPSLVLIAEQNQHLVGFKCGYQRGDHTTFYSWMGGVIPSARKGGVADAMLKEMEEWCINKRYKYLSFKTLNEHTAMLIFALKRGFEITGTEKSEKDERLRIWLTKQLI